MTNYFRIFSVPKSKITSMIQTEVAPSSHHTKHENGGADEIDATGLDGAGGTGLSIDDLFFQLLFSSLDGLDVFTSGSGAVTLNGVGMEINTNATTGSVASVTKNPPSFTPVWNWGKNATLKISVQYYFYTSTTVTLNMVAGSYGTGKGYGFKIENGRIYGHVGNGSAQTNVDLASAGGFGSSIEKRLKAVYTAGVKVKFYIDEVLQGESTTNLPTGTDSSPSLLVLRIENPGVAQEKLAVIPQFSYHQEA